MPDSDMSNTLTIAATTGHRRLTKSWVLGRLLRDIDDRYDEEMKDEDEHEPGHQYHGKGTDIAIHPETINTPTPRTWESLRVSVYEFDSEPPCEHGVPVLDWLWYSSCFVIIAQSAISIIPWILYGIWDIFLVTAAGTVLALVEGSLPQWREEKWACPKKGGATITITQGNGSRHAIVIKGQKDIGLDLEILAQGTRTARATRFTRLATTVLAFLWVVLLMLVAGLKQYSWCNDPQYGDFEI